jgi:hypothetical protein
MLFKAFQVFLVSFLVIFTAAGAILLVTRLLVFLLPSNGIMGFSGGLSATTFDMILFVGALLAVAAIFLIARRHRLR